jgi:pimeloyl-ACP methyl ester carboxylesterase
LPYPSTKEIIMHGKYQIALIAILFLFIGLVQAQDAETPVEVAPQGPHQVEVAAPDGLVLKGDFYLVNPEQPTVLLLHELYTTGAMWTPFIGPLVEGGYNVLIVDVRGQGATDGEISWPDAVEDVAVWLAWLRDVAGVRSDGISTLGSSIGSTLAIVGCANDELCRTTIAISPGWSYYGIPVEEAITTRPTLVIYAQRDRWPALGVPKMIAVAPETLTVETYPGNAHGTHLIELQEEAIVAQVLEWLTTH